jgi:hypothetical protein
MVEVFFYWDRGVSHMPPMIRHIYEYNMRMAKLYIFDMVLLTDANLDQYIQPGTLHTLFSTLASNHKSDIIRFNVLHQRGGIWLDTDVIIVRDMNILYRHTDTTHTQVVLDMETSCREHIGCASLVMRPHTICSQFCVDYVNKVLDTYANQVHERSFGLKPTLRYNEGRLHPQSLPVCDSPTLGLIWGCIGPDTVRILYQTHASLIRLNTYTDVTSKGCNFIDWTDDPGVHRNKWYFADPLLAQERARTILAREDCFYVITWTIYRKHTIPGEDLVDFVFDQPHSVFYYLMRRSFVVSTEAYTSFLRGSEATPRLEPTLSVLDPASSPQKSRSDFKVGSDKVASSPKGTGLRPPFRDPLGSYSSPSFHVLIATAGTRPSIQCMLDSLSPQLTAADALTIVYDGKTDAQSVELGIGIGVDVSAFQCTVYQHYEPTALGHWGHGIRNKYASLLSPRDFVMHADDDDVYTPYLFDWLRRQCKSTISNTIYVMTTVWPDNQGKMYRMPESEINRGICGIVKGQIGTPSGIIPFALNTMATWGYVYGGDGDFYLQLQDLPNVTIEFLHCIGYVVRPKAISDVSIRAFHSYSMKSTDDMISIIRQLYYEVGYGTKVHTCELVDDVEAYTSLSRRQASSPLGSNTVLVVKQPKSVMLDSWRNRISTIHNVVAVSEPVRSLHFVPGFIPQGYRSATVPLGVYIQQPVLPIQNPYVAAAPKNMMQGIVVSAESVKKMQYFQSIASKRRETILHHVQIANTKKTSYNTSSSSHPLYVQRDTLPDPSQKLPHPLTIHRNQIT